MKFSSYPPVTAVQPLDTFLIHQDSSNAEKQINSSDLAVSLAGMSTELNIAGLRAVVVTALVTGAHKTLYGYSTNADGGGGAFYYDSASVLADNGGTVIKPTAGAGRWLRPFSRTVNVRQFGATGDGTTTDTNSIQAAVNYAATLVSSSVYFPAGIYKITAEIVIGSIPQVSISFIGDGSNVSVIKQFTNATNGLNLQFLNVGALQPFTAEVAALGFQCNGTAGTGLVVSYGDPAVTINHTNPGLILRDVVVKSTSDANSWANGIDITSAWNCHLTDVFTSGSSHGGTWANLSGDGIAMHGVCVNSHLSNCQSSFFLNGFHWSKGALVVGNFTEGLFFSNCSFAQNRRGIYIEGDAAQVCSTIRIQGGLIETRAGIAGIHLLHVNDFGVSNTLIIPEAVGAVVGVLCDNCNYGEVGLVEFFAQLVGVKTVNTCTFINVSNCVFRGTATQIWFGAATTKSQSRGQNSDQDAWEKNDGGATNQILVGRNLGANMKLAGPQSIPDSTDTLPLWDTVIKNDTVNGIPIWAIANKDRLTIPTGVSYVKLTCGARWDAVATVTAGAFIVGTNYVITTVGTTNYLLIGASANVVGQIFCATGAGAGTGTATQVTGKFVKLLDDTSEIWATVDSLGYKTGDANISTAIVPTAGLLYFTLKVNQSSGGALNFRSSNGCFFAMEIIA